MTPPPLDQQPGDNLRAICVRLFGNELVAAECASLTGGRPGPQGVAVCSRVDLIPQAAYLSLGVRWLAEADTLQALADLVAQGRFPADEFRVEVLRLAKRPALRKSEIILAAANALDARPNLAAPRHRFLVVVETERLWFGEILSECAHSYQQHDAKPYRTSSSMPSRLARALVNLVAPTARSLLDPFCGTGSILLEACALGLNAFGMDCNPKMIGMTRRNLAYFGYHATATRGDSLACPFQADAIVTDLPYGRFLEMDRHALPLILQHTASLAPLAVYLSDQDISAWLRQAGYKDIQVWRVRKRAKLSRFVYLGKSQA